MSRTPFLHPVVREIRLVTANRLAAWRVNLAESVFSAVATALFVALLLAYLLGRLVPLAPSLVQGLETHAPPLLFLLLALAAWQGRRVTLRLWQRMQHGWWAAMPVPAAVQQRTGWLRLLLSLLLQAGVVALLLAVLTRLAGRDEAWLLQAMAWSGAALGLGAIAGGWRAQRARHRDPTLQPARHVAPPLLALRFLARTDPAHIGTWQHALAVRHWRSGGRLWPWLLLGVVVPANEALTSVIGLLVLGGTLLWLGNTLRATHEVMAQASALLAALPARPHRLLRACLRYPAFAVAVAVSVATLGLLLLRAQALLLPLPAVFFSAYAALDLLVFWRHRLMPRRAGLRLTLDLLLCFALLQVAWPLALAVYLALLVTHGRQAARES